MISWIWLDIVVNPNGLQVTIMEINRRKFIKNSVKAACTVGLGAGIFSLSDCGENFSTDKSKPNIILITADDMGWKDLSCYGNKDIKTGNIDKIAEEGVKFTNAFVVSSSCSPSRAALLTGQYPHTNGVTALTHRYKMRSLPPFYQILPSILKENGYNTGIQGKNHVSPYVPVSCYGYKERMTGIGIFKGDWNIDDSKKSLEFIKKNKENRFYLELNFLQNHRVKKGLFFQDKDFPVDPEKISVPEYWALPDWKEIREDVAKYYSQTLKMNSIIGEILEELERSKIADNTMIVFLSDNGAPFPGNKLSLYDRGTGTPVLIKWPKKIKPGTTVNGLTNAIDIMPSILDAAGIEIPDDIQGKSFWGNVLDNSKEDVNQAVFTEMTSHVFYIPTRAARTKKWKYIRNYSDIAMGLDEIHNKEWAHKLCELPDHPWKKPRLHEELYYLPSDPNEQKNLADSSKHKKDLERMRKLLDKHMVDTKDPFYGKPFTNDYKKENYDRIKKE